MRYAAIVGLENFAVSTVGVFELERIIERLREMKGSEPEAVICARIELTDNILKDIQLRSSVS